MDRRLRTNLQKAPKARKDHRDPPYALRVCYLRSILTFPEFLLEH